MSIKDILKSFPQLENITTMPQRDGSQRIVVSCRCPHQPQQPHRFVMQPQELDVDSLGLLLRHIRVHLKLEKANDE